MYLFFFWHRPTFKVIFHSSISFHIVVLYGYIASAESHTAAGWCYRLFAQSTEPEQTLTDITCMLGMTEGKRGCKGLKRCKRSGTALCDIIFYVHSKVRLIFHQIESVSYPLRVYKKSSKVVVWCNDIMADTYPASHMHATKVQCAHVNMFSLAAIMVYVCMFVLFIWKMSNPILTFLHYDLRDIPSGRVCSSYRSRRTTLRILGPDLMLSLV